jgi:metal transporter CNNM
VSTKIPLQGKAYAMDGVDELSIDSDNAQPSKVKVSDEGSNYTPQRRGSVDDSDTLVPVEAPILPSSQRKTESLPSRRTVAAILPDGFTPFCRHVSAAPRLPQLQRVTPFSRQNYSSYERMEGHYTKTNNLMSSMASDTYFTERLSKSEPPSKVEGSKPNANEDLKNTITPKRAVDSTYDDSQGALSLVSWYPVGLIDVDEWTARLGDSITTIGPRDGSRSLLPPPGSLLDEKSIKANQYQGFPPELLTNTRKENHFPNYLSCTLPKMNRQTRDLSLVSGKDGDQPRPREETFHDDRPLLPSQRRLLYSSATTSIQGTRSSSFWI